MTSIFSCIYSGVEIKGNADDLPGEIKSENRSVTVTLLTDSLLRFTLYGESTNEVLCRTLQPVLTNPNAGRLTPFNLDVSVCDLYVSNYSVPIQAIILHLVYPSGEYRYLFKDLVYETI